MLLDRPIIAFDIETIPDPEIGRRLFGIAGSDEAVIREMVRLRLEESGGTTEYPQSPWHRIVTICATLLGPKTGRVEIRALGNPGDERSILEAFFALIKSEQRPRLVSWNGSGFDLPVIRYRSMLHGVSAPAFYRTDGELRFNNYQNRYHDLHLDVMDVLSGYGASSRVGLANWTRTLGLPGKPFVERAVFDHVLAGELPRIIEYCKLDTLETLLAFLSFAHHVGDLSEGDLRRYVAAVRATVQALPFEGWRGVEQCLAHWPHWLPEAPASPSAD
jgi:3'-5' exonuclease